MIFLSCRHRYLLFVVGETFFLNLFVEKKSFSFERKDELKVNETANK